MRTLLGMTVIVAVGLVSMGCKKKPKKVRCSMKEIEKVEKTFSAYEKSHFAPTILLKACKGWPSHVKKGLKCIAEASPDNREYCQLKKSEKQAIRRDMERICPGYYGVLGKSGNKGDRAKKIRELWKHCKFSKFNLMKEREFVVEFGASAYAIRIYKLLVDGGMDQKNARNVSRWMFEYGSPIHLYKYKIQLPKGGSAGGVTDSPLIVVTRDGVYCDEKKVANIKGGRIDSNAKRDGPEGFFITGLWRRLNTITKKIANTAHITGHPNYFNVVLAADKRLPYRTVAEVLYTAREAGYRNALIVTEHPDQRFGTVLVKAPVRIKPEGYVAAISKVKGGNAAAQSALLAALKAVPFVIALKKPETAPSAEEKKPGKKVVPKARQRKETRQFRYEFLRPPYMGFGVGVRMAVDGKGKINKLATRGAPVRFRRCCLNRWVGKLKLDPKKVPAGTYTFQLGGSEKNEVMFPEEKELAAVDLNPKECGEVNLSLDIGEKGGTEALASHAWMLFSKKHREPWWWSHDPVARGTFTVKPKGDVTVQDVIHALDAIREVPASKLEKRPEKGCRFSFDRKKRQWSIPSPVQRACMYPYIVLSTLHLYRSK